MNPSKPPALAMWLLQYARFGATDGALAGDLMEEFNRRRSAAWYWRQVLMAIIVGCASEIRHHRVLAIQTIVVIWTVNYAAMAGGRVATAAARPFVPGLTFQLASWGICFLGGTLSGAIMALLHRKHRSGVFLTSGVALLGWAPTAILFLKRAAIHHRPLSVAAAAVFYWLVACAGFAIGALPLTLAGKTGTSQSERPFAAN